MRNAVRLVRPDARQPRSGAAPLANASRTCLPKSVTPCASAGRSNAGREAKLDVAGPMAEPAKAPIGAGAASLADAIVQAAVAQADSAAHGGPQALEGPGRAAEAFNRLIDAPFATPRRPPPWGRSAIGNSRVRGYAHAIQTSQ